MRILVIGSGGREHALIKALAKDSRAEIIYALPGNPGMTEAVCLPGDPMNHAEVLNAACSHHIDFCIVTPDDPLASGLVDTLEEAGIACFGPTQQAARIESSKVFSKELMKKYGIPTAVWQVVSGFDEGIKALAGQRYPVVIKADGLAKGKGVFIAESFSQSEEALRAVFCDRVFGASGSQAVIEEYLEGPEVSVLTLTDSERLLELPSSMDHKRAFDGDRGPNTGGMGAIAPNPFYTAEIAKRCRQEIYLPTLRAMVREGCPFRGCLYFGLILTEDGPKVLEYNARFGDPETQAVLQLFASSPLDAFLHCRSGELKESDLSFLPGSAACVVVASEGYPGVFEKGFPITEEGGDICYAGVAEKNGHLVTSGGRVAAGCGRGETLAAALDAAYRTARGIHFENRFMRGDIGYRALKH